MFLQNMGFTFICPTMMYLPRATCDDASSVYSVREKANVSPSGELPWNNRSWKGKLPQKKTQQHVSAESWLHIHLSDDDLWQSNNNYGLCFWTASDVYSLIAYHVPAAMLVAFSGLACRELTSVSFANNIPGNMSAHSLNSEQT